MVDFQKILEYEEKLNQARNEVWHLADAVALDRVAHASIKMLESIVEGLPPQQKRAYLKGISKMKLGLKSTTNPEKLKQTALKNIDVAQQICDLLKKRYKKPEVSNNGNHQY